MSFPAESAAALHAAVLDALPANVALVDVQGTIVAVNESWRRFARENGGADGTVGPGQNYFATCEEAKGEWSAEAGPAAAGIQRVLRGEIPEFALEYPCHSPAEERWFRLIVTPVQPGQPTGAVVTHLDVTAATRAEQKSKRLMRLYAVASAVNSAIVHTLEVSELYPQACRIAVEEGGLLMAWVGLPRAADDLLEPIAIHGQDAGYLEEIRVATSPTPLGQGPSGRAFRENAVIHCHDIALDPSMEPWREPALRRGFRASAAFPLRRDGQPFAVFTVYAGQAGYFDTEELELLTSLAENLAYAVEARQRDARLREEEERRRASEERFALAVRGSSAGVWDWNVLTSDVYYSPRYLEMLGFGPEELPARLETFYDLLHPDDHAHVRQALAAHLSPAKTRFDCEFRLRTRAGDYRWFRSTGQAVYGADGHGTRMVGGTFDITEGKQSELQLRAALADARRFREALDQVGAYIYLKDTASRYLYANRSTLDLFHCTASELIGSDDARFFPPETAARVREVDARVLRGERTNEEIDVTRAGGERRIYREIKTPVYADPASTEITGLLGVSTDITPSKLAEERIRESEARFRQLAETIHEVFWIAEIGTRKILYVNPAYERIWGQTCASLLAGQPAWLETVHRDDRERVKNSFSAANLSKPLVETYRILRPDGSERWIRDHAYPVLDERGERVRMAGIAQDITEQRQLEARFLRAQRMESIGTLAGGIAHDLNNMLAPVLMSLELLKLKFPDRGADELIETLRTSAQRAADLVKQVLSFSRGVEGQRLPLPLPACVQEVERIVHETFPKSLDFRCELPRDLWDAVGDSTQIQQVLLNLCINARDAMPGGGRLGIALQNVHLDAEVAAANPDARPGAYVRIEVSDTGSGIAPELRDRIFEPFFTTKPFGQGTGLGLSTTLAIVKSHGGFIDLVSAIGKGTTFQVYLPANAGAPGKTGPSEPTVVARGHGELILVVDDETAIRTAVQCTLESFGYRVLLASEGAEAVALYARNQSEIALVLTDMSMPVMDGAATIVALRAINPAVRIIASSGLASSDGVPRASVTGTAHFVRKPYSAVALLQTLERALAERTGV